MPVTWEELPSVQPDSFTITTTPTRLAATGNLFAPLHHPAGITVTIFNLIPLLAGFPLFFQIDYYRF